MVQYKLHSIVKSARRDVQGLTIPEEVAQFFSGCYFKIEVKTINGKYGIFCQSGALNIPTLEQVEAFDYRKYKIG